MALRTKTMWWGVVVDAQDGPELARFYARLLGRAQLGSPDRAVGRWS
jgi:hypothetical protein